MNSYDSYTVTVAVTRSDSSIFNGYIKINTSSTVTITSGTGSFTIRSESVGQWVWSVTDVLDSLLASRTYSSNDLSVVFDKILLDLDLTVTSALVGAPVLCIANLTSIYSGSPLTKFMFNVYVDDAYHSSANTQTFTITFDEPGMYSVRIADAVDLTYLVDDSKGGYGGEIEIFADVATPEEQYQSTTSVLFYLLAFGVVVIASYLIWNNYRQKDRATELRNMETRILTEETPMVRATKKKTRTSGKRTKKRKRRRS